MKSSKAERLELIHTDLWGKASMLSLGSLLYFVTFIDDTSRKVWIYFLKKKSEVFDVFKKWLAQVENKIGLKLKYLKSEIGGNTEIAGLRSPVLIKDQKVKTVSGNFLQNRGGRAMNKTFLEHARSCRYTHDFPSNFR